MMNKVQENEGRDSAAEKRKKFKKKNTLSNNIGSNIMDNNNPSFKLE